MTARAGLGISRPMPSHPTTVRMAGHANNHTTPTTPLHPSIPRQPLGAPPVGDCGRRALARGAARQHGVPLRVREPRGVLAPAPPLHREAAAGHRCVRVYVCVGGVSRHSWTPRSSTVVRVGFVRVAARRTAQLIRPIDPCTLISVRRGAGAAEEPGGGPGHGGGRLGGYVRIHVCMWKEGSRLSCVLFGARRRSVGRSI